jgi:hypothetical protein
MTHRACRDDESSRPEESRGGPNDYQTRVRQIWVPTLLLGEVHRRGTNDSHVVPMWCKPRIAATKLLSTHKLWCAILGLNQLTLTCRSRVFDSLRGCEWVEISKSRSPLRPPSWHRLGPRDMPFETKGSRHVAVAIPEVPVSCGIAVSLRQESPQPQQPDVAYHQTLIGRRGR